MRQLVKDLKKIPNLDIRCHVDLKSLTTFRVGDRVELFLMPRTVESLEMLLGYLEKHSVEYKIIGNGSNLLVKKAPSLLISLCKMNKIVRQEEFIQVGSGAKIAGVINWCVKRQIGGLEPLFGIPGSIGGALQTNAGACGASIGDYVDGVLLTSADGSQWQKVECSTFGYRKSKLPHGSIVSSVRFRYEKASEDSDRALHPQSSRKSLDTIRKVMQKRLETQPIEIPSAGCIFKNPEGASAWYLISESGLKGYAVNDAQVSEKHANFIVNRGSATPGDILKLIDIIKERVLKYTNICLEEEVIIWQ